MRGIDTFGGVKDLKVVQNMVLPKAEKRERNMNILNFN
jgi:hypothetical protein